MITYSVIAALVIMLASLSGILFTHKTLSGWMGRNQKFLVTFSAGVFAVIIYHLIEESFHSATSLSAMVGSVAAGAIALELLSRLVPDAHHHHESDTGHAHSRIDARRMLLGDAMHNIGDGLILVPAFLVDIRLGLVTALAIFIHELVQEISEFFVLKEAGYSDKEALFRNFFVSASILVGVALGSLASSVETLEGVVIAFAAGGFIHVVLRDLVPYSIESVVKTGRGGKHALAAILGIAIMLIISIATPHTEEGENHSEDELWTPTNQVAHSNTN